MKVPIKFLKGWRGYNAGEIAGFDPTLAGDIVNSGVGIPLLLSELKQEKEAHEAEDKARFAAEKKARIRASSLLYQGLIEKLDPKKDKKRIKELSEEKDKMATLIAESKS